MDQKDIDKKLDTIVTLLSARVEQSCQEHTTDPLSAAIHSMLAHKLLDGFTQMLNAYKSMGGIGLVAVDILRAYADTIELTIQEAQKDSEQWKQKNNPEGNLNS